MTNDDFGAVESFLLRNNLDLGQFDRGTLAYFARRCADIVTPLSNIGDENCLGHVRSAREASKAAENERNYSHWDQDSYFESCSRGRYAAARAAKAAVEAIKAYDEGLATNLISAMREDLPILRTAEESKMAVTPSTLPSQKIYVEIRERAFLQLGLSRPLRVFLCHCSADKSLVRDLYRRLRNLNIEPWLDEENLLPGQDWNEVIKKAVRSSDIVLVCLSNNAINKVGYVQREIRYALDVADEQPEEATFIVPIMLEECDIPERLRRWHCVSISDSSGYERLINAFRQRASSLGLDMPKISS